jgi:fatty acid desaturase
MNIKNLFVFKIAIIFIFQALSIYLMGSASVLNQILGVIVFGLINAHAIQIIHQCSHFLGFKNRAINDYIGVLLSLPVLINFHSYRSSHFIHHKKLGTKEDSEVFGFNNINSGSCFFSIIPYFFGYFKILSFLTDYKNNWKQLAFYSLLSIAMIKVGLSSILILWMISLVFVTEPAHFMIEIPEHYACQKISAHKFENTRTIKSASVLARWFTNWNNFHVEHHMYQWVLPENLEEYHDIRRSENLCQTFDNYVEFYKFFIKDIFKKDSTV